MNTVASGSSQIINKYNAKHFSSFNLLSFDFTFSIRIKGLIHDSCFYHIGGCSHRGRCQCCRNTRHCVSDLKYLCILRGLNREYDIWDLNWWRTLLSASNPRRTRNVLAWSYAVKSPRFTSAARWTLGNQPITRHSKSRTDACSK